MESILIYFICIFTSFVFFKIGTYIYLKITDFQKEFQFILDTTKKISATQNSLEELGNSFSDNMKKSKYVDLAAYSVSGMALGSIIGAYATYQLTDKPKRKKKSKNMDSEFYETLQPILDASSKALDSNVDGRIIVKNLISDLSKNLKNRKGSKNKTIRRKKYNTPIKRSISPEDSLSSGSSYSSDSLSSGSSYSSDSDHRNTSTDNETDSYCDENTEKSFSESDHTNSEGEYSSNSKSK
jgi:hypothetical protein